MQQLKLDNIKLNVEPHSASKDFCILTLKTSINGMEYSESISVYSKFIFDNMDSNSQSNALDEIVSKLSYDLVSKAYLSLDKRVKSSCDMKKVLESMKSLLS